MAFLAHFDSILSVHNVLLSQHAELGDRGRVAKSKQLEQQMADEKAAAESATRNVRN